MNTTLPLVGITLGDVSGISPEIIVKTLKTPAVYEQSRPVVIGDARIFTDARFAALYDDFVKLNEDSLDSLPQGKAGFLDIVNMDPAGIKVGQINQAAGRAAVEYVIKATELALDGKLDAIATAPVNKEAMHLAGFDYIGHTEILADITNTPECTTMLATPGLAVTHVTRHLPFREIADHLTIESILRTIQITDQGMRMLGYTEPRLAVAGLNPHNGDNGLMGREELDVIAPAVQAAQAEGITAIGPIPADSVFFAAIDEKYDVVVCMYHDQGHIAVKTHGFEQSITITLGIPVIRTSADHGTAFDIAGQGIAHPDSMIAAVLEAARIAKLQQSSK